ncbi:RluA family pseudouridine synthase [Rickettsiales bacterium]|nr:RluA family pseudouridine synthase [Rickettsiales bacterium]
MDLFCIVFDSTDKRVRMDLFLLENLSKTHECITVSRTKLKTLVKQGFFSVNEKTVNKVGQLLNFGDVVSFDENKLMEECSDEGKDQNVSSVDVVEMNEEEVDSMLDVVYEDADILVINKPVGVVMHSSKDHKGSTVVDALIAKYGIAGLSDERGEEMAGIIHRLDKNTTGLVAVAKTNKGYKELTRQIQESLCKKFYMCLCYGVIKPFFGTWSDYIVRDSDDYRKYCVVGDKSKKGRSNGNARLAIANYKTKEILKNGISLVEVELVTGRKNQIRVQLDHIKHPIVGDDLYKIGQGFIAKDCVWKDAIEAVERQMLHSYSLSFVSPETGEEVNLVCELPSDMMKVVEALRS